MKVGLRAVLLLACLTVGTLAAGVASASTITRTAFGYASDYRALVNQPLVPGFEAPAFDDSAWPTLSAPFGNDGGCPFPAANTYWPAGTTVQMRKSFALPAAAYDLRFVGTIDNQATVWLNGNVIAFSSTGNCFQNTIDVTVASPSSQNVIAVLARDFGGVSFFDMQATYKVDLPTSKDACKKGGWEDYGVFKNQGDCVSFVATGGMNPPANG